MESNKYIALHESLSVNLSMRNYWCLDKFRQLILDSYIFQIIITIPNPV